MMNGCVRLPSGSTLITTIPPPPDEDHYLQGNCGHYVDPMLEAEGHAGLSEMVTGVQARFPGHRFRRVSGIDTHHDQVRFAWELVAPDGAVVVGGIDIGALAADGRLRHIAGFFGAPPAEAAA